jgi:hypothetical protein
MRFAIRQTAWLTPLVLVFLSVSASGAAVNARITRIKGEVESRKTQTAQWVPASAGDTLSSGAVVRCKSESEAFIAWKGNAIRIGPLSIVSLDTLTEDKQGNESNELRLASGSVFAKISKKGPNSQFKIKTPTAVAGVRGTGFEASEKRLAVVGGKIAVTPVKAGPGAKEIELSSGQKMETSDAGFLAGPIPLTDSDMKTLNAIDKQCAEAVIEYNKGFNTQGSSQGKGSEQSGKSDQNNDKSQKLDQAMDQTTGMSDRVDVIDSFGDRSDQRPPNVGNIDIHITY